MKNSRIRPYGLRRTYNPRPVAGPVDLLAQNRYWWAP